MSTLTTHNYQIDQTHSRVGFEIPYMISKFSTSFKDVQAELVNLDNDNYQLIGKVSVDSIDVDQEQFRTHLMSPDFFDVANHPYLEFASEEFELQQDFQLQGQLTIKGHSHPVTAKITAQGPIENAYGQQIIGLEVHTQIDRTSFGLDWNMNLPSGKPALSNRVDLVIYLQLVGN